MPLPWYRRPFIWLWLMVGAYIAVFSAICLRKYGLFLYDAIDLGYFSQVFWNFLHGQPFVQTIHPHLSLGDHAELAIPLILPLYALWPDPRGLLIIQTVALALCAWPIYLLTQHRLKINSRVSGLGSLVSKYGPLALAAAWLVGPIVQNISLYEFHILPFAILPLLFALLAYDRGQKTRFLVFAALALLVREDAALVVATFGLLALVEKKPLWWRIVPAALGLAWFAFDMALIGHFAPAGGYKFAIYYSWLGSTPLEMALTVLRHPLRFLGHFLTIENLEMIIGFLMAVSFLPLLRPRRLLLAAAPLAIIVLGATGGGELVLDTHYASLFLPALFAAAMDGLAALPAVARRADRWLPELGRIVPVIACLPVIVAAVTFGPLPAAARQLVCPDAAIAARAEAAAALVARVPSDAPVAASYRLLPALASRPDLYSIHYQFLGVTQFAEKPYSLPPSVRYLAWDSADALAYAAAFPDTAWTAPAMDGGFARLRWAALREPIFSDGQFLLFDRQVSGGSLNGVPESVPLRQDLAGGLKLDSIYQEVAAGPAGPVWKLTPVWSATRPQPDGLAMTVSLIGRDGRRWPLGTYPLGQGLVGPRELDRIPATLTIALRLAGLPAGDYHPLIEINDEKAVLRLDGLRSAPRVVLSSTSFGSVLLPAITVP